MFINYFISGTIKQHLLNYYLSSTRIEEIYRSLLL